MTDQTEQMERELLSEMDRLEEKVAEIARTVHRLQEEKRELERQCAELRNERSITVGRLSNLIDKVDSLRGEL
jgi:uncharacterized coiled-coil DUF342 family protein